MSLSLIDRCADRSRWRDKPVAEKLVWALGLLVLSLALPPWPGAVLVAACAVVVILRAGVMPRALLCVLAWPFGFLAASAVTFPMSLDWHNGLRLIWSAAGAAQAGTLCMRAIAAFASLLVLTLTTPMGQLATGLRAFLPASIVELILLMHRLVFVFGDTLRQMRRAQELRLGYHRSRSAYRSLAWLLAALLVRTLERARAHEDGLAARGYRGELPVLCDSRPLSYVRIGAALSVHALLIALSLSVGRLA